MLEVLGGLSLGAATVTTGLLAGLFYAFAVAVMPGLRRADARTFVEAMQRINVAILNPWFLLVFAGVPVSTLVAGVLHLSRDGRAVLPWIAAAFVLSCSALVITIAINIPLNDALDAAGPPDRVADLAVVRDRFETRWVRWNVARAVLCTAALGCLVQALLLHGYATAV